MNILIFDPSGTSNYCNGLADALCDKSNLSVVVRDNYMAQKESKYRVYRYFKMSATMGKLQKGLRYLYGYLKTLLLITKGRYDVIHIQWFLLYPIDIFFLKILKKYCPCIVYTAHNVIPHMNGMKCHKKLSKIYNNVNRIIVHGNASKNELLEYFPNIPDEKIFIQKHGIEKKATSYLQTDNIPDAIKSKIRRYNGKKLLFLGVIFEAKGVDRLLRFWNNFGKNYPNDLLIVAGIIKDNSQVYAELVKCFIKLENTLYLPGRVSNSIHDYLYYNSDIVLLPYRHASMSGVVFDAANFSKVVLTTDVGCISEYLENSIDSYIVENDEKVYGDKLKKILKDDKKQLEKMGQKLNQNVKMKCNWDYVADYLLERVYG